MEQAYEIANRLGITEDFGTEWDVKELIAEKKYDIAKSENVLYKHNLRLQVLEKELKKLK